MGDRLCDPGPRTRVAVSVERGGAPATTALMISAVIVMRSIHASFAIPESIASGRPVTFRNGRTDLPT